MGFSWARNAWGMTRWALAKKVGPMKIEMDVSRIIFLFVGPLFIKIPIS